MNSFHASVGRKQLRGRYAPGGSLGGAATDNLNARNAMNQVVKRYKKLIDQLEIATPNILYAALEPTFEKSQDYCPQDTGRLVASGYLEIVEFRGKPTVQIGYGKGGDPEYAVTVHENLEWRHKAPTRAKWLQVALAEDANDIERRIVSAYQGMF